MGYCDTQNLLNLIPQIELVNLTNDDPQADFVCKEQVEDAISYADELINCSLRSRYSIPLKLVPKVIRNLSLDISAYRLYLRRPQSLPDHIKDGYEKALGLLKLIQTGKMVLDSANEHPGIDMPKEQPTFLTNKTKKDRIFNDSFFKMFGGRI